MKNNEQNIPIREKTDDETSDYLFDFVQMKKRKTPMTKPEHAEDTNTMGATDNISTKLDNTTNYEVC